MDKIQKFLVKLTQKDKGVLLQIFKDIQRLNLGAYDVKRLKGMNLYQLRKGKIRVVYGKDKQQGFVVSVAFRKDSYK